MIKRYWLYILTAIILLLIPVSLVSTSDSFKYCTAHQGQYPASDGEQKQSATVPVVGKLSLYVSCTGSYANVNGVAITAIATILLTFVTAGLVWTAYLQIHTARAQLRAYVYPVLANLNEGSKFSPPIAKRKTTPYVYVEWKNTGQTPASKVVVWSNAEVTEPINEDRLIVPPLAQRHVTSLGANAGGNRGFWFRPLTASEMADVSAGVKAIYLYGRIEYLDIFKEPQFTNFRFFYAGIFPLKAGPTGFSISQNGNDST